MIEELKSIRYDLFKDISRIDSLIDEVEKNGDILLSNTIISKSIVKTLNSNGCITLKDVGRLSFSQISKMGKIGKKGASEVVFKLKKQGIYVLDQ
jgi:hypothetical protein